MADAFTRASGTVAVGAPAPGPPDVRVLAHPAAFHPRVSRVVFHETVHLWQHVGSRYLAELIADDWTRLGRFEATGDVPSPGAVRMAFLDRSGHGFSAADLYESLARYWDVHVLGPARVIELELDDPRRDLPDDFAARYRELKRQGRIVHPEHGGYSQLAYRMAMQSAAGNYAAPYLRVTERIRGPMADYAFPLAGYFALQTREPVAAFTKVVDRIATVPQIALDAPAIHDVWRRLYLSVGRQAHRVAAELDEGDPLGHLGAVAGDGALADHPVWTAVFELRAVAAHLLESSEVDLGVAASMPEDAPDGLLGHTLLDYALACPGDPDVRFGLFGVLAPWRVVFTDGVWELNAAVGRARGEPLLRDAGYALAAQAADLDRRWDDLLSAQYGY